MGLDTATMAGSRCPVPSMPLAPQQLVQDAQRWYLCGQNFHYFSHNYQLSPALQHTFGRSRSESVHSPHGAAAAEGRRSLLPPSGSAPRPAPGGGPPSPSSWRCGSSDRPNPSTATAIGTSSRASALLPCTHPGPLQGDERGPAHCGLGSAGSQHTLALSSPWSTPRTCPGHQGADCGQGNTSAAVAGAAAVAGSRDSTTSCTTPVPPWATAQSCPGAPGWGAAGGECCAATGSSCDAAQAKHPAPNAAPTAASHGSAVRSGPVASTTSHSCQRVGAATGRALGGLPVHSSCTGAGSARSSTCSSTCSTGSSVCGGSQRSVSYTSGSGLGSASGSDGESSDLPSCRGSPEAAVHTCGRPHAYPSQAHASPAGSPGALFRPVPGSLTAAVVPLAEGSCPLCVLQAHRAGMASVSGRGQAVTHLARPQAASPGAGAEPVAGAAAAALAAGPAASHETSSPEEPGVPYSDPATCQGGSTCHSAHGGCTQAAPAPPPPDGGAGCASSPARARAGGGTYGGRAAGHGGGECERQESGEPHGAQDPRGQLLATAPAPPLPPVRVPALPALEPHDTFVGAVVLQWCEEEEGAANCGRGLRGGGRGGPGAQGAARRAGGGVARGDEGPLAAGEGLWGSVLHGLKGLQGVLAGAWGPEVGWRRRGAAAAEGMAVGPAGGAAEGRSGDG